MVASREYVEQVLATYRQAADLNHQTPTRQGNLVAITPGDADEVMITGDLHGHCANFEAILALAQLDRRPRRHLILQEICHGGPIYPGGGCMSHAMLEDVARLKCRHPVQVHFLLGNHELAELMDFPIVKRGTMLNFVYRCGLREAYGAAMDDVRRASLEFLRSCPLAVRLPGDVFVCHSVPEGVDHGDFDAGIFDRPLDTADYAEHGSLFNLVWGRDYRPENAQAFARLVGAKVIVNGHEPCTEGFKIPNDMQIILDCSSHPATYLMLPSDEIPTHADLVRRIQTLPGCEDPPPDESASGS